MGGTGKCPCKFTQRDPNAIDTSATIRKAFMEEEKKQYCEQGHCFHCLRQRHIARNCPNKQPKVKATSLSTPTKEAKPLAYKGLDKGDTLAEYALKLTNEERAVFIKRVVGEDEDLQNAWACQLLFGHVALTWCMLLGIDQLKHMYSSTLRQKELKTKPL